MKEIEALISRREAQIKQIQGELDALRVALKLLAADSSSTVTETKAPALENPRARSFAAAATPENNRNQFI